MNLNTKKFFYLLSITAAIILVIVLISQFAFPDIFTPAHYITVVLMWLLTIGIIFFTKKGLKKKSKTAFINMFMSATIVKLFILLIYILIYLFTFKEKKVVFLVFTLINYFIFTFFEVYSLVKRKK